MTIPDSVTSLGDYAFYGCSGLTSVTMPNSVASIGHKAFYGTKLATVYVASGDTYRVKTLLSGSGYDVSAVNFIEDVMPDPVSPDPVTPDPVMPDPVMPDPVTPGPVTPDPVTPDPVTPDHPVTPEPVSPVPVTPEPEVPVYEVIGAEDIVVPYEAPKAVTLKGAVFDAADVVGIVELKLGKVSKGKSNVSGTVTGLDGKKHTIKAVTVSGIDGVSPVSVSLAVKGFGTMEIAIGGDQFAGSLGDYHVQSIDVGGTWTAKTAVVDVAIDSVAMFSGNVLDNLLPSNVVAAVSKGKWSFAKAASVKWAKPKKGTALPEIYDEASGKGLIIDVSKGKTNLSGLKLAYTPKTGMFKGSFKVYALQGEGKKAKLKSYTVSVNGAVVGGVATAASPTRISSRS